MTERPIKSAERTLRLFELFSRRQGRLTVSDVARGLAIPQSSASMLLTNLAGMGYLEYNRDRSYAPTVRVALLGSWLGPRFKGPASLAFWLDELHRDVGEDLYVGIQNGSSAQIVFTRRADDGLSVDSDQMHSLTKSAIGQAILASNSDREVIRLVRRCNAEAETRLRVNEVDFLTLIYDIRRQGFAVTTGYFEPDRMGVAVHIPSATDCMTFGVGFGGSIDRLTTKRDLILRRLLEFRATLAPDRVNPLGDTPRALRFGDAYGGPTPPARRVASG